MGAIFCGHKQYLPDALLVKLGIILRDSNIYKFSLGICSKGPQFIRTVSFELEKECGTMEHI